MKLLCGTIDYLTNSSAKYISNPLLTRRNDEFSTPLTLIITHLS